MRRFNPDYPLQVCGCNSVVECFVANEDVVGSSPTSRSKIRGCSSRAERNIPNVEVAISKFVTRSSFKFGPMAQSGARLHGMQKVVGSSPTRSTK